MRLHPFSWVLLLHLFLSLPPPPPPLFLFCMFFDIQLILMLCISFFLFQDLEGSMDSYWPSLYGSNPKFWCVFSLSLSPSSPPPLSLSLSLLLPCSANTQSSNLFVVVCCRFSNHLLTPACCPSVSLVYTCRTNGKDKEIVRSAKQGCVLMCVSFGVHAGATNGPNTGRVQRRSSS